MYIFHTSIFINAFSTVMKGVICWREIFMVIWLTGFFCLFFALHLLNGYAVLSVTVNEASMHYLP